MRLIRVIRVIPLGGVAVAAVAMASAAVFAQSTSSSSGSNAISMRTLLDEMTNRANYARMPAPSYRCLQSSSYDRATTTPTDEATWFANDDQNHYLRVEGRGGRKEWVMMEHEGPGAIVRIWSANPAGTLRVYVDGQKEPVLEGEMTELLGGRGRITPPLSAERSKGWNLYLPIPFASSCKVTSDKDGFYYHVDYRAYPQGARVESFRADSLEAEAKAITLAQKLLTAPGSRTPMLTAKKINPASGNGDELGPGEAVQLSSERGPMAVTQLWVDVGPRGSFVGSNKEEIESAMRSLIVEMEFDGEKTVWCPLGDFFGSGVGLNEYEDWWRTVKDSGLLTCRWIMPFRTSATVRLVNRGTRAVRPALRVAFDPWTWDERSMHFWSTWHAEYPIHTREGAGTRDWNYVEISGKGVYMGDVLSVMNPVETWWGEGDEKIYVDGEKFPSHIGTGTEDYYGYAWCWPARFSGPFHAQVRCDGEAKRTNLGHTTVTRSRGLDAIPFSTSLKFDMEVWHWKQCDMAYAATTYFYALPGASTNREPQLQAATGPIPQAPLPPPPMKIAGAFELEGEKALTSPGVEWSAQEMDGFARGSWSGEGQLWLRAKKIGDWAEFRIPTAEKGPVRVTLHATRSWDYATVQCSLNGAKAGDPIDLCSGEHKVEPTGPIDLGTATARNGEIVLRLTITGTNPKAEKPGTYFGVDCVVLTPMQ